MVREQVLTEQFGVLRDIEKQTFQQNIQVH